MDYKKHYDKLIDRAKNRTLVGYSERHHIIPKCLGGSNAKSNLVRLTPEEHYVAHLLLVKMNPGHYGLLWAAQSMIRTNENTPRQNKMYGWLRRKMAKALSEKLKGRKMSPETCAKMSASRLGKKRGPHKEATKQKMSKASKGKPKSQEHKESLSKAKIGKKRGPHSEEHKEKLRQSNIEASKKRDNSVYNTEEYKLKQSIKSKEAWRLRKTKIDVST